MQDINSRENGGQGRMKGYMGTFSVFNSFFCKPEVRKIKSVNLIFFFFYFDFMWKRADRFSKTI